MQSNNYQGELRYQKFSSLHYYEPNEHQITSSIQQLNKHFASTQRISVGIISQLRPIQFFSIISPGDVSGSCGVW